MDLEPLFYYFVIAKTPNMSKIKWEWSYLNQYSLKKNIKGSMGQRYPFSAIWKENIVAVIYFVITETLNLSNVK